ncbi:hypothetical protein QL285_031906 [Trifolium repens]|nr:hypothetical protein QL285_031906 [Trifolium repens]
MNDTEYHIVNIVSTFLFRILFERLILNEIFLRIKIILSDNISNRDYKEMQKYINKNNRRHGKYDVITNPRSIVPTDLCSRIWISTADELSRVHQERGRSWVAVIPKKP